jgi:photosystem II core protein PsbZ
MLQISLLILVALSFFLIVTVPLAFTIWQSGRKTVFSALSAWGLLVGVTGFLSSVQ